MKISRINRVHSQQETATSPARKFSSLTAQSDLPVLLSLQTMLAELPDLNYRHIMSMQLALQRQEICPDAAEIAAAMMVWFCSNQSRQTPLTEKKGL